MPPYQWVSDVERVAFKFTLGMRFNVAQLLHICCVKHGLAEFQPHWRVDLVDVEQVGFGADKRHQRHHDGFANRVNGRVGHLRKQLLEVVVEWFIFV